MYERKTLKTIDEYEVCFLFLYFFELKFDFSTPIYEGSYTAYIISDWYKARFDFLEFGSGILFY